MAVLTGFEGALYHGVVQETTEADGSITETVTWTQVAHVRNWSITVTRDVLETTGLGDGDRTYVQGLRGATGTATILYDDEVNEDEYDLWNEIFRRINCNEDKTSNRLKFKFNNCVAGDSDGKITFRGYVTSFTHNVSVGEVQTATINFTSSGEINDGNPYPN